MALLEICAYSVESALAAQAAGADRIELCAEPCLDGVTPSHAQIASARKQLRIPLHVIIRPRGGDFVFSEAEFAQMKTDVLAARSLSADGIVTGVLRGDGSVDAERCRELVELALPCPVIFHRAMDAARDQFVSLEQLIACGFTRVLTSGGQASALAGIVRIAKLVRAAGDRIIVIPGGGVRSSHLADLLAETGARECHSSARKRPDSEEIDVDEVRRLKEICSREPRKRAPQL